jgi:hypothetical protein
MVALVNTFFRFQDDVQIGHDKNGNPQARVPRNVKEAMKIAVARIIIVFCEALRLKTIYTAVKGALESIDFYRPLPETSWKLIRWWGQLSEDVQTMRRHHNMALHNNLPSQNFQIVGISTLDHVIGQNGELVFSKLHKKMVITEEDMLRLENDIAALNFVDPTFREQQQQEEVQEQQQEGGGGRGRGRRGRGRGAGRGGRGRGEGRGGRGGEAEVAARGRGRGGRGRGGEVEAAAGGRGRGGRGW